MKTHKPRPEGYVHTADEAIVGQEWMMKERLIDIQALARKYGVLYKAASDLIDHWHSYQDSGIVMSPIRWLEITEEHINKIAAILKEHQR